MFVFNKGLTAYSNIPASEFSAWALSSSPLLTASVSAQLETLLSHLLELIQFGGGDERQIVIFINGGVSRVFPPSCCCCLWLLL